MDWENEKLIPPPGGRVERRDVSAIITAKQVIEADDAQRQYFCRTYRAWELWQEEPLMRLKRWPDSRVFHYQEYRPARPTTKAVQEFADMAEAVAVAVVVEPVVEVLTTLAEVEPCSH